MSSAATQPRESPWRSPSALSVVTDCVDGIARVVAHAVNEADELADIRFTTAFGEVKTSAVAPGAAAEQGFATDLASIADGTVTIAGYARGNGYPSHAVYSVPYAGVTCER